MTTDSGTGAEVDVVGRGGDGGETEDSDLKNEAGTAILILKPGSRSSGGS
jgi:hypothetical protein